MRRRVLFICLLTTLLILSKDVEMSSNVAHQQQQGPMFTSSFSRDLTFLNTDGGVLPCSAYGRPNPDIEWISLSGKKLVESPGLLGILSNGSLHFKPYREEQFDQKVHAAVVRCRAVNSVGSIISPEIHIKSVPVSLYQKHNVQVNDAYVTVNNTAILHCSVNPYYLQKYVLVTSWIQNGRTIAADERYSLLRSGELHIRQVLRNDSYSSYRCVTRNLLTGEEKTSDPAHLIVVDSVNSGPVMKNTLSSISAVGGSAVELPCVANGVPLPQFSWSKDGAPLTIQSGKFSRRGGNLVISGADVRDSGNYVCTAKNDFGRMSLTLQLEVYDPLRAYIEPSELTVDLNGSAVFNCVTSGHPIKTIQWYKDGHRMTFLAAEDDHLMSSSSSSGAVLEISRIQRQDAGMYQCLVSNDEDSAQGTAQLLLGVEKPIVIWSSDEEYAQIGRGASLRCSASGRPVPAFHWTVDDVLVVNSSNVKVTSYVTTAGDVISHVNISSVSLEDGGSYRCTVLNKAGTDFRETRLNIYGIPYIRPMNDLTRVAGELLVLPCYVTGYPVHRITWYKGNVQLPINHRQYIRPNGMLVIDALDRYSDEGVYICDARDARGQGMNRSVYVRIMEPPKIDPFQFPRRKQGDRVSISCIISSGDLPLNVTWLKNGLRITPDNGVSIQKTGAYSSLLSISYVDRSHSGNYTCTASNSAASVSHSAQLSVNVAPQWRVEPENSVVVLGHDVIIDCQTDGDPLPVNTWKKTVRGQLAQYVALKTGAGGSVDDRIHQLGNGSLWIREAEWTDEGQYLCQSTNGVGPDLSKVILLSVHVPAHFKLSERNYTAQLDDSVAIECAADGDLPMSVMWSYALEALKDRSRMQTTSFSSDRGSGSRLLISSVRREDTGFYVCSAENVYGRDVFTAQLVVVERADPPRDLVVTERGSHRVRLNWAVGFDGNSPITGWMVQVRTEDGAWQNVTAVTFDVGGLSVDVMGLKPATVYEARVSAANQLGFGRPSNVVTFKTAESEPSGAPRDVDVRATGSRSLQITWKPPREEFKNGKIIGYHIGYRKNNSDSPYLYITKRLEESCVLENLEKFTHYAVHVQALTAVGPGPRSEDVVSMTLEDVPSHYPDEVKAVAVSSESIQLSWAPPPLSTLHGNLEGFKVVYRIAREDEDEMDATTIVTKKLSTTLVGLHKYTNYSIQLMAYTRMGEGVASPPIHLMTLESTPDMPADVKAVVAGSDKVLVSWKPPLHANGVITKFTVYRRDITSGQAIPQSIDLHPSLSSHVVSGLSLYYRYGFRVSASTAVGESESTREIVVSTVDNVSARIASFSSVVYAFWYDSVFLHCLSVGVPPPNVTWKKSGVALSPFGSNSRVLPNGTLVLFDVQSSDAAEYTCRAENKNGADEITISVVVQAPPRSPVLSVSTTTSSSIQIVWRTASNGGSRISEFSLFYRHHGSNDWSSVDLGRNNRSYIANDLLCGSEYSFYIRAHNRMGEGVPSNIVSVKTNGSSPIMPPQSLILSHVNSTFAILAMDEWQIADCPILFYDVQYQIYGDSKWHYIQRLIHSNVSTYRIDLHPSTWYIVKVTAHSSAGSTECILKFATKSYFGATIEPIRIEYRRTLPFYKNVYVMLSASIVLVIGLVTAVAVGLYCRRWQLRKRFRATASRLHQDPKAAFVLPSDADKLATSAAEDRRDVQTYVAAPSLTYSALRLVTPRAGIDVRASDEAALQDRILSEDENDPFDENQDRIIEEKIEDQIAKSMLTPEDDLSICPYATFPLSHQLSTCHAQNRYDNLNETISSVDVAASPPQEIANDAQKSQYQNFHESLLRRGSNVPPPMSSSSAPRRSGVRSAHPPPPPIRRTLTLSRDVTSRGESLPKE